MVRHVGLCDGCWVRFVVDEITTVLVAGLNTTPTVCERLLGTTERSQTSLRRSSKILPLAQTLVRATYIPQTRHT